MSRYKEKIGQLNNLCINYRLERAIEFGEQGHFACDNCPLYKNGMCDMIFNEDKKAAIEVVEKAIKLMEEP